ncbi:hypothetical protein ACPYO6_00310 [Georgenia sp. Z1344]|uniref:hypothetical protein n=1 Tax=Georgenia sp. Z1344 TaxID=3416706 RepID=UPI003CF3783B
MSRKTLAYIALVVSILFGAGFIVFEESRGTYAIIGGAVVAIAWISVGYLGKPDEPDDAPRDRI